MIVVLLNKMAEVVGREESSATAETRKIMQAGQFNSNPALLVEGRKVLYKLEWNRQ